MRLTGLLEGRPGQRAGPNGRTENFTVLNTVLIFGLERRAQRKSLKSLARPERFELPTPRFVVWCFRRAVRGDGESPCRSTTRCDLHSPELRTLVIEPAGTTSNPSL
jgi:hypothetical protein